MAAVQPRAPNFQYFERWVQVMPIPFGSHKDKWLQSDLILNRPKYRYPYYDEHGRGKLLYGYGGPELYQYKSYSPLEGIH